MKPGVSEYHKLPENNLSHLGSASFRHHLNPIALPPRAVLAGLNSRYYRIQVGPRIRMPLLGLFSLLWRIGPYLYSRRSGVGIPSPLPKKQRLRVILQGVPWTSGAVWGARLAMQNPYQAVAILTGQTGPFSSVPALFSSGVVFFMEALKLVT